MTDFSEEILPARTITGHFSAFVYDPAERGKQSSEDPGLVADSMVSLPFAKVFLKWTCNNLIS